jgi:hypothetical protein
LVTTESRPSRREENAEVRVELSKGEMTVVLIIGLICYSFRVTVPMKELYECRRIRQCD